MHPNPAFRQATRDQNLSFARDQGFGVLTVNGPEGPLISHIPYLINDAGTIVELHLVRSNPILRQSDRPQSCVLAITAPHSYVSPDWYGAADMVPTWNYVAVHIRGTLEKRPEDELQGVLERLSGQFEDQLNKTPWTMDKMDDDALARMLRQIVPFRITIQEVQGTWKLGQNKTDDVLLAAAEKVAEDGIGLNVRDLADLMRMQGEN